MSGVPKSQPKRNGVEWEFMKKDLGVYI